MVHAFEPYRIILCSQERNVLRTNSFIQNRPRARLKRIHRDRKRLIMGRQLALHESIDCHEICVDRTDNPRLCEEDRIHHHIGRDCWREFSNFH